MASSTTGKRDTLPLRVLKRAIRSQQALLAKCTPDNQPTQVSVDYFVKLLTLYEQYEPGAYIADRLDELEKRMDSVQMAVGFTSREVG